MQMRFRERKVGILIKTSLKFVFKGQIDINPALVYIIIWTNADPIHWRVYVLLGVDSLFDICLSSRRTHYLKNTQILFSIFNYSYHIVIWRSRWTLEYTKSKCSVYYQYCHKHRGNSPAYILPYQLIWTESAVYIYIYIYLYIHS